MTSKRLVVGAEKLHEIRVELECSLTTSLMCLVSETALSSVTFAL
jgi:hypothetical protein